MPIDTSFHHPPNATAQDKLLRLQVLRAGSSPFDDVLPKTAPDTSVTATCPDCRAKFIAIGDRSAEDNLARHTESRHQPKPKTADAAATELVRATIADRVGSGELRVATPGAKGAGPGVATKRRTTALA